MKDKAIITVAHYTERGVIMDYQNPNDNNNNNRDNGYYYHTNDNGMPPLNRDVLRPSTSGLATGALICGIAGIVFACCCGIGLIPSIVGLVLALVDRSRQKGFCSTSLAGLICSAIGIVFGLTVVIYMVAVSVVAGPEIWDVIESMLEEAETETSF